MRRLLLAALAVSGLAGMNAAAPPSVITATAPKPAQLSVVAGKTDAVGVLLVSDSSSDNPTNPAYVCVSKQRACSSTAYTVKLCTDTTVCPITAIWLPVPPEQVFVTYSGGSAPSLHYTLFGRSP